MIDVQRNDSVAQVSPVFLRITLLATGAFRPAGYRHSGRDIFRGEDPPCTRQALLFMSLGRRENRAWRIAPEDVTDAFVQLAGPACEHNGITLDCS